MPPIRQQLTQSFKAKISTADFWLHITLFGLLGLSLWPVTEWIAIMAQGQSRLFHALIVLTVAIVTLVRFGGIEIRETLTLNPSARRALIASFVLLFAQFIGHRIAPQNSWQILIFILVVAGYCCSLAALIRFVFGEGTRRLTRTAAGTLCGFLMLSVLMQPLDWPLRNLAGEWSAHVLGAIGKQVTLGLVSEKGGLPMLILLVNEYPFHVASECNGFGVILTSLLIALLLGIYRRLGIWDISLNLIIGLLAGFAFNIIRIVIIVLLAPAMMEHYMLMHEIVGGIAFWSCLLLVWILLNGPTQDEPPQVQSQSESM